MLSKMNKS